MVNLYRLTIASSICKVSAMFRRNLEPTLRRLAGYFPVVAITGPRQSGKTELAPFIWTEFSGG